MTHFLQRQRLSVVIQPEAADDNLPFTLIQARQDPLDLLLSYLLGRFLSDFIAADILLRGEQLILTRAKTIAPLEFFWNRARKILHDRPARIRAELIAARKVEFLDSSNQRHVPIAHQAEKVLRAADVPLGYRNHQP